MQSHNDSKQCSKCKQTKSLGEFHVCKKNPDGLQRHCKKCRKIYFTNPTARAYQKQYVAGHRKEKRKYDEQYRQDNAQQLSLQKKDRLKKLKNEVFGHYGGKCQCCGEDELDFLAIDHIKGGGEKARKENGLWGNKMYIWLRDNNYPKDFRVLCHNCNWSTHINGGICAHQKTLNKITPKSIIQI